MKRCQREPSSPALPRVILLSSSKTRVPNLLTYRFHHLASKAFTGALLLCLVACSTNNSVYCERSGDCELPDKSYCDIEGYLNADGLTNTCVAEPQGEHCNSVEQGSCAANEVCLVAVVAGGVGQCTKCTAGACETCGLPGEACCPGDRCDAGGCCESGSCVGPGSDLAKGTLCSGGAPTACGADGQACCADSTCAGTGSCCVAGACVANAASCGDTYGICTDGACLNGGGSMDCGGIGANCCNGNPNGSGEAFDFCTTSGTVCNADTKQCGACGGAGQPCCEGVICSGDACCDQGPNVPTCVASGDNCSGGDGTCSGGGCEGGTCGLVFQAECNSAGCTGPYTENNNNICEPCGGLGQECCDSAQGKYCGAPNVCFDDGNNKTCGACGGIGQPCCLGDLCPTSGTCNNANSTCQ
jgi:hypothetical protein